MIQPAAPLPGAADSTDATSEAQGRGWFALRRHSLSLSDAIRHRLVETLYSQPGMLIAEVICTAGLAALEWDRTGFAPAELIAQADKALYAAKEAGRNRVSW